MLSHRVLLLFPRLVLLTVLLGLLPPAALPAALAPLPVRAAVQTVAAPAAVTALPAQSHPVPRLNVTPANQSAHAAIPAAHQPDFGRIPLAFMINQGQTDPAVRYHVRGLGGNIYFTPDEVVLSVPTSPRSHSRRQEDGQHNRPTATQTISTTAVRLRYEGAHAAPGLHAVDPLPGHVNYLIGADRSKWQTDVPTYRGIVYQSLYDGIDLRYEDTAGEPRTRATLRFLGRHLSQNCVACLLSR